MSQPASNPNSKLCDFYLPRKRRFCKTEKKAGSTFCPTHTSGDGASARVPCPLNPNHTIFAADVERHVKVCPDKRFDPRDEAYYRHNVNVAGSITSSSAVKHSDLSEAELSALATKVCEIYDNLVVAVFSREHEYRPTDDEQADACDEHTSSNDDGDVESAAELIGKRRKRAVASTKKHTPQHWGILLQVAQVGWLPPGIIPRTTITPSQIQVPSVILELGAGKAGLALALREQADLLGPVGESLRTAKTIVVDKGSFRHKRDACVAATTNPFVRIRIDIKDFFLSGLPNIDCSAPLVIGKHLCGACTDFALNTMINSDATKNSCIAIATCCHHLCDPHLCHAWAQAVVEKDDSSPLGHISLREMGAVCSLTSWAVCGKMDPERELLGWKCKRVIDYIRGRFMFEAHGFSHFSLRTYVPTAVTKENVLLLLW